MNILRQNQNPLQHATESADVRNWLMSDIVDVDVRCSIHGTQIVKTFAFRRNDVKCPECDREISFQREYDAQLQAKRQKVLDSGIGERYYSCTFNDWRAESTKQQNLLSFAKAWANNFDAGSQNIALIGSTGTGKTMLASILGAMVINQGKSVKMLRSSEIAEQARATWHKQSKTTEADFLSSLINCDLLIIDEFGEGDIAVNAEWADQDRARLSKIIDGRYLNGKSTIITGNHDKAQFMMRWGARAWDRLQQNLVLVVCDWASYRAKQGVSKFVEIV